MDPKANLTEQLRLASLLLRHEDDGYSDDCPDYMSAALRLAELVEALHNWRVAGGFDPYLAPKG
jgi:hypothetical protein